jgi:hypothetical protein
VSDVTDNRFYRESTLVPAVDVHCEGVWLTDTGYVEWLAVADEDAPEGWRRLYVEQREAGDRS